MKNNSKKWIVGGVVFILLVFFLAGVTNIQQLRGGTIANRLPAPVRGIVKTTLLFLKDFPSLVSVAFARNDFETVRIELPQDELDTIYSILSDEEYLKRGKVWRQAKVYYEDKEYDAKVKLRGDTSPHWAYEKKSWRINLKDNDRIFGLPLIEFIVPHDRLWVMEHLNNERARLMGLPAPESRFANLVVNGKNYGIYFVSERLNDDFIRDHNLPANSIIYGEREINREIFNNSAYWEVNAGDQGDYKPLMNLIDVLKIEDDGEFYNKLIEIVDIEQLALWNAHSVLAGSEHQDWAHDMRIIYNPEDKKLRFIPWDVMFDLLHRERRIDRKYNPILNRLVNNKEYQVMRGRILWRYVSDKVWREKDAILFEDLVSNITPQVYLDRTKEVTNQEFNTEISKWRSYRTRNINQIRDWLKELEIWPSIRWSESGGRLVGAVEITTQSEAPHRLKSWSVDSTGLFKVYLDNGDGVFSFSDTLIGQGEGGKRIETDSDFSDVMAAKYALDDGNHYSTFFTGQKTYKFFLITSDSQARSKFVEGMMPLVSFTALNLITDEEKKVDIEVMGID